MVVEADAREDHGRALVDAGGAGSGTFGFREVHEVGALAAGRQGLEGLLKLGFGGKSGAEFVGNFLRLAFDGDLGAVVLEEDGFLDPLGELLPMLLNLDQIRAPKRSRRLRVGPGGHEHPVGIAEQRALEKVHRGKVLEGADNEDVFPFVGVAGLLPLQVLGEARGEGDFAQGSQFFGPSVDLAFWGAAFRTAVASLEEEFVDFGIRDGALGFSHRPNLLPFPPPAHDLNRQNGRNFFGLRPVREFVHGLPVSIFSLPAEVPRFGPHRIRCAPSVHS